MKKNSEKQRTKSNANNGTLPLRLEVGMRVKAVCMTKLVGDYVVLRIGPKDEYLAAWLGVFGDEPREDAEEVIVESMINPVTGRVRVLKGQKIQATDYYYWDGKE